MVRNHSCFPAQTMAVGAVVCPGVIGRVAAASDQTSADAGLGAGQSPEPGRVWARPAGAAGGLARV